MDIQAKIKALQKEKGVSKNQATAIAYAQKNSYAQQGLNKNQRYLNTNQSKDLNNLTNINFTPEFAKSGYFITEADYQKEAQQKIYLQNQAEIRRKQKITDITSESESPFSNRRIWHSQKPEYYVGQEVTEGNQYTTIPYSKWENFKTSPEYLKYKGIAPQTTVASRQLGGYAQTGFMQGFGMDYDPNKNYDPYTSIEENNWYQNNPLAFSTNYQIPAFPTMGREPEVPTTLTMANINSNIPQMTKIEGNVEGINKGATISEQKPQEENRYYPNGAAYDMGTKIDFAGYNFGKGNNVMGTLGLVSAGLEGLRTGLGSYASAKESTRVAKEYQDKLFRDNDKYEYRQQGGEKKLTNAEMYTDQYIADEPQTNINVEGGEFIRKAESGDVKKVVGEPHIKNGKKAEGVDVYLDEGDKVLSDYTKIPAKNIKELKERYDLTLKKGATFADAQKMFDRKIGITKLTDELAETIEKLDDNEIIKDATTKRLNELVLAKKIKEKKEVIDMLKDPQSMIFEDLFGMQELVPKKGDGSQLLDKNGKVIEEDENVAQQGGEISIESLARKHNLPLERAEEIVAQQGGMIKRADGSYSKRGLWDNIRKNRGSGKKPTKQMLEQERKIKRNRQEGGEEMPMEQEPQDQMQQVFQAIAQMMQEQVPPQEIAQQLVEMGVPQEQVGDLISQVAEQLSQQAPQQEQQMPQEDKEMAMQEGGGIPESYKNKGFTKVGVKRDSDRPGKKWMVLAKKGDSYKVVHGGASGMKDYSQHGSEERKKRFWSRMGGRDSAKAKDPFSPLYWHSRFGTWQQGGEYQEVGETSDMIEEALNEGASLKEIYQELLSKGLSQEMASDLLSEYEEDEEQDMAQEGGYAQEGQKKINEYLSQWMDKPDYNYGDTQATAKRFKPFFDKYGIKYTDEDLKSNEKIDGLAGQLQTKLIETDPDLAADYGERIEPTRKGLQWLVDNKAINPTDYNLKLQNGKVSIGSYGNLSDVQQKKLQIDVQALDSEKKKDFSKTNYNDNQGFYRVLDKKEIEFTDKAEYDKYIKDNEKNKVGNSYRTDKLGAYITPVLKQGAPTIPAKTETPKAEYTGEAKQDNTQADQEQDEYGRFGLPQRMWMPPPAMQPIRKEQIDLQRQEPIKATTEPYLAEQERQRQTDVERVMQSGLTPQQQEAMLASGLASSQMASNDAISKVEQYNAQNQFATDQFNIGQRSKEDLTNAQYNQAFMDKTEASQMNNFRDWSNYYNDRYKNDFNNWDTERKVNLGNQMFENYKQNQNGVTYEASQGKMKDFNKPLLNKLIGEMTAEQRFAYGKLKSTGMSERDAYNTVIKV